MSIHRVINEINKKLNTAVTILCCPLTWFAIFCNRVTRLNPPVAQSLFCPRPPLFVLRGSHRYRHGKHPNGVPKIHRRWVFFHESVVDLWQIEKKGQPAHLMRIAKHEHETFKREQYTVAIRCLPTSCQLCSWCTGNVLCDVFRSPSFYPVFWSTYLLLIHFRLGVCVCTNIIQNRVIDHLSKIPLHRERNWVCLASVLCVFLIFFFLAKFFKLSNRHQSVCRINLAHFSGGTTQNFLPGHAFTAR